MGRRRRRRILAVIGLVGIIGLEVAACSGPPDPVVPPSASATVAPATAPPVTQDVEADGVLAERALLTVEEVPGGPWSEADASTDRPSGDFRCPALADDAAFFDEQVRDAPSASAPALEQASPRAVLQLEVRVLATTEMADRVSELFADPQVSSCLEDRFADEALLGAAEGLALADVAVEAADLPTFGDASSAWAISLELAQGSQAAQAHGLYVTVQVGRGLAFVVLIGQEPITAADVAPIAGAATEELATTLGG